MLRSQRLGTSTEPADAAPSLPGGEGRRRKRIVASIIVPCYNEEAGIERTIEDLRHELVDDETVSYEFILIDDHSTDRTSERILPLAELVPSLKLVQLGSNCGSHVACRAGLDHCTGDVAIFLTADLQEGPDLALRLINTWRHGAEIVCTVAEGRDRGGLLSNAAAGLFYFFTRRFDRLKHVENPKAIPRLLGRKAIDRYCRFAPRNHNMTVWLLQQRFKLAYVYYTPVPRLHGHSKWTLHKRIQLAVNTYLDITTAFLTGWLPLGIALGVLGVLAILGAAVHALAARVMSLADLALFLSGAVGLGTGLVLAALGTIGTYIWRIYDELRNGPEYTVQRLVNLEPEQRSRTSSARLR
jgi:polyisoprenyl-phosphate glycosyltransferase